MKQQLNSDRQSLERNSNCVLGGGSMLTHYFSYLLVETKQNGVTTRWIFYQILIQRLMSPFGWFDTGLKRSQIFTQRGSDFRKNKVKHNKTHTQNWQKQLKRDATKKWIPIGIEGDYKPSKWNWFKLKQNKLHWNEYQEKWSILWIKWMVHVRLSFKKKRLPWFSLSKTINWRTAEGQIL